MNDEPRLDARFLALMGWLAAVVMLVSYLGHDHRFHVRSLAIDKIPECVTRPFLYDPLGVMRSK